MTQPADPAPLFRDPHAPLADRVADLVQRMTLPEKISQMVHNAPAVPRLGIPPYDWWSEGLHGVGRAGVATVFPQAIGLGATWHPQLVHAVAAAVADEARAKHHDAVRRGIHAMYTGLTYWSPNINLFRDPRWGRGQETYGEDPYLTANLAVAYVTGLQGDDPRYLKLVATPKHFAVHSGPESRRHEFDAHIDMRDLRGYYLFAFEAAVKVGRAASIMGAYNRVNGEPCCASPTLLQQILRGEWGFDGFVVSDCGAIHDIHAHHKVVDSAEKAAALAVTTGCDLNCGAVYAVLPTAVERGLLDEAAIDRAVTRLFHARFRLGMFDPPEMVPYAAIPPDVVNSPAHRALALQAARESIVLLKNEGDLLPLSPDLKALAVIGPNADDLQVLQGNYNGTPDSAETPLEGIRRRLAPHTVLYHAPGCPVADGLPLLQPVPSVSLRPDPRQAGETGLRGRYYAGPDWRGDPVLVRIDSRIDFIWRDGSPLSGQWGDQFSVRWDGFLVPPVSGTYQLGASGFSEYRVLLDGELLLHSRQPHHPVRQTATRRLEGGRFYRLRIDYANAGLDPQFQLLWSPPDVDHLGQALDAARKADAVVLVLGLSPLLEGEEMPIAIDGFDGGDRTDIALPAPQADLLRRVQALGKPVVLVLTGGGALAVNWAAAHVPAIVMAWYPGQAGGTALAEVLFGDYNPAGRLPVTFYRSSDDLPPFTDYSPTGRTYRTFAGPTLYPFGHGLSYTTFTYVDLRLDRSTAAAGEAVAVRVDVTNSGTRAGDEVVQLYADTADDSGALRQLVGFMRLPLAPGERRTVTFTVHANQLGRFDAAQRYLVGAQAVTLRVGGSAESLPLSAPLTLTGPPVDCSAARVFFSTVTVT